MPYRQYSKANPARYYTQLMLVLGRRGAVLFFLGAIWVFQGISTYFNEPNPSYALLNGNEFLQGTAWVITGLVAMVYAKKPQGYDVIGFVFLYIMAAFRIVSYGFAFIHWLLPSGTDGNPRGIVGVFSWATIIILLIAVAGWKESEEVSDDGRRID